MHLRYILIGRSHTACLEMANKRQGVAVDEQVFADGIGTISVIGGTVRLDFVTYSPTEKDASGQPAAVFRQRLIMGMETFLHAAEKIHEAAQTLSSRAARSEPVPLTSVPLMAVPPVSRSVEEASQERPTQELAAKPPVKPPFP